MRVLVVDDAEDIKSLYEAAALSAGVLITIVHNAFDALKTLGESNYQFDAAILDLKMDYLDGLTLSDQIRINETQYRETLLPIFFYTGYPKTEAVEKVCIRNKVSGIFIKTHHTPIDVFEAVKGWRMNKENGHSNPNLMIVFVAVVVQIIAASLFLWLLNRQDVAAAYEFTRMKSERDQLKNICDSNNLLDMQKEQFIKNSNLILPPELSGQKPCQTVGSGK